MADLLAVCKHWQQLDLESLRAGLDAQALQVAEYQDQGVQKRRMLAEATKDFKQAMTDSGMQIKGLGSLLKQYQEEIDRLTKRCKHCESAFVELYDKVSEAPDPARALAAALETASRVADLEAQNKKLSHELAEYKAESAAIKNQDLTIRRLEEKVRGLEAALEEKTREVEEVREAAVAEADAARMVQMQEREEQLSAMLAEAQAGLAAMQKLHTSTQNQLFAIQSQTEEEQMNRQVELDLATAELERAQERLLALEREKEQIQQQQQAAGVGSAGAGLQQQHSSVSAAGMLLSANNALEDSLRQELHTQRELAARLRLEVSSLQRELEEGTSMWEARTEGLKASLVATELHARALEQELALRPTNQQVEELKGQIRMLQAVGYNTLGDEEAGGENEHSVTADSPQAHGTLRGPTGAVAHLNSGGGGRMATGSLEAMLVQKNRLLEHELTMLKLKVVDSKTQLDAAHAQLAELQQQLAEKLTLVAQLEEDLVASRRLTVPSGGSKSEATKAGLRQNDGLAAGAAGSGAQGQEEEDGQSSMMRVVCGQRDRFRARALELEEELARLKQELGAARNQLSAAQADNVALVERLRYVHGFKAQQRHGKPVDVEVGADAERRYGRLYDEGINPFKQFQGEQRERQKSNLHFADKLMFMFGQLVFGSTGARLATFTYLCILHLLVVGSLARMMHHSSGALYAAQQGLVNDPSNRHNIMLAMHDHQ